MTLAGCWAHARRGFFEAKAQAAVQAFWILGQIQQLYEIEAELRERGVGPNLRLTYRLSRSQPVVNRLHRICLYWQRKRRFLPQSAMGKAIHYLLKHWFSLCLYLDDPKLEIDNNLVENAIRPTALGKKNWLFLVIQKPGIAALSSTPWSLRANVIALIPTLTSATCSLACLI